MGEKACGALLFSKFVYSSREFCWGQPLDAIAIPSCTEPGAFDNVGEIMVLCANRCGRYLLAKLFHYVQFFTHYDVVVVASTLDALEWYQSWGFVEVAAYRSREPDEALPYCHNVQEILPFLYKTFPRTT